MGLHWGADNTLGSEHTIRGITYPMEMQLMHQTSSGEENKLAITSFLFEVSEEENPVLASLVNTISKIKTVGTKAHLDSPPESIEDENHTADERSQEALDVFSMDQGIYLRSLLHISRISDLPPLHRGEAVCGVQSPPGHLQYTVRAGPPPSPARWD